MPIRIFMWESNDLNQRVYFFSVIVLMTGLFLTTAAVGGPFTLRYGGRLTSDGGKPVQGPVDLKVEFFRSSTGGSPIAVSPVELNSVELTSGVFQVELPLNETDSHIVFNGTDPVWIQITDQKSGITYPRQEYAAVPYALKIPVDGATLSFDADGKLRVNPSLKLGDGTEVTLPTADGITGQVLQTDGDGNLIWANAGVDTNAEIICDPGEYLDGGGTCQTSATIVSDGGGLTAETDPGVTAFAKAALPTCGAGEVLKGDGTSLSCVSDQNTDVNTNAETICDPGEYLDGGGACKTAATIVSNGGGLTAETDPQVGANTTNYVPKWSGSALVTGSIFDDGGKVGIGTSSLSAKFTVAGLTDMIGGATDASNLTYISFKKSDGTSVGFVGDGSTGDDSVSVSSLVGGALRLSAYQGGDIILGTDAGSTTTSTHAKLTIMNDGKVGIGAPSPDAMLHIDGTDQYGLIVGGESGKRLTLIGGTDDHPKTGNTGSRIIGDVGQNIFVEIGGTSPATSLIIMTDPSDGGTADTETFAFTNDGRLGVGTVAPQTALDVNGAVRVGTSATCDLSTEGSIRYNSTSKALEFCDGLTWNTASSRHDYLLFQDVRLASTGGQLAVGGSWTTRNINTETADTGNNATLSSNQVTLQPGSYHCHIHAPAYKTQRHLIRLYNVTNSAIVAYGTAGHSEDTEFTDNRSHLHTVLNLAAPTTFRVDHYAQLGFASYGAVFGIAPNAGQAIYTVFECVRFK